MFTGFLESSLAVFRFLTSIRSQTRSLKPFKFQFVKKFSRDSCRPKRFCHVFRKLFHYVILITWFLTAVRQGKKVIVYKIQSLQQRLRIRSVIS